MKVTSFTFNLWNHLTHEHFAHNERRTVTFRTYQSNISEFTILTRAEWPYSVRAFQSTLCTVSVSKLVKPYLFYCIMDGAKLVSGALKHVWLLFYMWISDFDNVYLICITLIYRGATVLELSTLGDCSVLSNDTLLVILFNEGWGCLSINNSSVLVSVLNIFNEDVFH